MCATLVARLSPDQDLITKVISARQKVIPSHKKKRIGGACGNYRAPLHPFRCASSFMVRKSQTGFVHRGNIEHRGRSHSICEMGPGDRAFSSGVGSKGRLVV